MSFWTGLEALSGHRPGAFTGFSMKDLFEKDMWDRLPRTWSGKMGTPAHLKANPMDQRLTRGGEPMMTNWYKGGGMLAEPATGEAAHTQHAIANRPVPYPNMSATYPTVPAQTRLFPLQESNITATALPVPGWTPPRNPAEVKQQVPANPTNTLMNMGQKFISGWQDLARKRLEDKMRIRQNYNHPLREFY